MGTLRAKGRARERNVRRWVVPKDVRTTRAARTETGGYAGMVRTAGHAPCPAYITLGGRGAMADGGLRLVPPADRHASHVLFRNAQGQMRAIFDDHARVWYLTHKTECVYCRCVCPYQRAVQRCMGFLSMAMRSCFCRKRTVASGAFLFCSVAAPARAGAAFLCRVSAPTRSIGMNIRARQAVRRISCRLPAHGHFARLPKMPRGFSVLSKGVTPSAGAG